MTIFQRHTSGEKTIRRSDKESSLLGSGCGSVVEQSLPIPEVRGSNPVIGKNLFIY